MIAGIDVGMTGAIGMIYDEGGGFVYDMPVFKKEVNAHALASLFREFPPAHVWIEQVNAFGMGRTQLWAGRWRHQGRAGNAGYPSLIGHASQVEKALRVGPRQGSKPGIGVSAVPANSI